MGILIEQARGKLKLARPTVDMVQQASTEFGARSLPITHFHSLALAGLPPLHNDPFDRMLIAQARSENLVFMTGESFIRNYPVETLWCGK